MSLLLAGLICAGASGAMIVGRWLARRRDGGAGEVPAADAAKKDDASASADAAGEDEKEKAKKPLRTGRPPAAAKSPPLEGFPCQLGDVLMRETGEEAWLAGALVLSEEVPVSALFVAPDAGHDTAIYARPKPRAMLCWLEPLDPSAVLVGGEPPTAVELRSVRFDRVRRLPVRAKRAGVGAPDVGDVVVIAEYASAGSERLLVLKGNAGVRAFHGHELDASAFEVVPSGDATME